MTCGWPSRPTVARRPSVVFVRYSISPGVNALIALRDEVVGRPGQEVDKLVCRCDLLEYRARRAEHAAVLVCRQLGELLVRDLADELLGDGAAVFELGAVVQPLPDLRA